MLILVADDDDDLRAAIVEALQSSGHTTIEARDGEELLELLDRGQDDASGRPDLLVTDVKMPRLSGLGVLEALRGAHWKLPVVVVTAFSDASIETVAMRLGASIVLHKPFGADALLEAVLEAERDLLAG